MPARPDPYPPARIVSGPAFEVVAELAAFTSGPARASLESGKPWIREVRARAGAELIDRIERWGFPLYSELASVALEAGPPFTPDRLVARLRAFDPDALRRRLLGADSPLNRAMVAEGTFDRALAGDSRSRAALRRAIGLNPPARQSIDRIFATPAAELQADISGIVELWAAAVSPAFAERAATLTARDVEAKERLFRDTPTQEALRVATNGVEVDPTGWASEIVVVPTVALRPFIAPVEQEATLLLVCSVGDEAFDDDPAAPPRRLVQAAAALGDELRLRILRELAGGEATASQLATRLGVDRTSLHHHLGILRSAGLVAMKAQGVQSWRYSLRVDGVATASEALAGYLLPREAPAVASATTRRRSASRR